MRAPRLLLAVLVGLTLVSAFAPVAEANHRCYTLGDYTVCRYIPGDEYVDCLKEEDWVTCVVEETLDGELP